MKTQKDKFRATHKLGYDLGVWINVIRVGDYWVTKEGKKYLAEDGQEMIKEIKR